MSPDGPFAVIGLGLIGGSLARDLAAQGATVWGHDADAVTVRRARRAGVLQRVIGPDLALLARARTVVFAVPVDVAPVLLERASPFLDGATLITDVGSTKQRIVSQAAALGLGARFVGSHPLAGDSRAGWSASRRGLFSGARVDLCRGELAGAGAWRRARALWASVGAKAVARDARMHDAEVAFSSHLPQLLALALGETLSAQGIARCRLGPGGTEMTRLCASSAEMWTAILDDNAASVTEAIDRCQSTLGTLRRAVARRDRVALRGLFDAAHRWMEAGPTPRVRSSMAGRRRHSPKRLAGDDR